MSSRYEIEIKSLLGDEQNAERLRQALLKNNKDAFVSKYRQLNHYFTGGNLLEFSKRIMSVLPASRHEAFSNIVSNGKNISVRTRDTDGRIILVIKASIDDTTSSNGISRMEFEHEMDMTLDELDRLLLSAGFEYQAKWSREREEYVHDGVNISIDKNAGYGYLAEFEKVITSATEAEKAKNELRSLMGTFGAEELAQDRLERMFAYYNANWREYYGTENTFIVE
ncbi:MAG: hypothetical protein A2928_01315 [Candidatus Taylorbacteria bacterium RIFCSPLOWO2_01_FULL_45_15b]|uniref:CYTH domain-containing protein n=1 Tax=Candidatus Taylorbacteria bacterium RIFCSPLOWO2_01_FULL_45_15b TaxID=1802319 RepID=A0A1G2NAV4_9BACT|nr:MAG: hypothetical protein A2928_01315 [Candidatus Taylorbacteria bacterium RIFCSPLOWO2_01_FULL_45_15b]